MTETPQDEIERIVKAEAAAEEARRSTETPQATSRRHLETSMRAIVAINTPLPDLTTDELLSYVQTTPAPPPGDDRPLPVQGLRAKVDAKLSDLLRRAALDVQEQAFSRLFRAGSYGRDQPVTFTPDPHRRPTTGYVDIPLYHTETITVRRGYVFYDEVRDVPAEELARAGVKLTGQPRYDPRVGRDVIEAEFIAGAGDD